MDQPTPTLDYRKDGAVGWLTILRADRHNTMTGEMISEAARILEGVRVDPELRVLVLTGAGPAFCPGADIRGGSPSRDEISASQRAHLIEDFGVTVLLHEMPAVTVAGINGACAGAGLGWALACDLRVAAAQARFNFAFLDMAVAGDMGVPWTLSRIVGSAKARDLSFFPRKFGADEAKALGLVSEVFPDGDFRPGLDSLVARLAGAAPLALRTLKANYVDAERLDFRAYISLETERHQRMLITRDTREAFAASAERRPPVFQGT